MKADWINLKELIPTAKKIKILVVTIINTVEFDSSNSPNGIEARVLLIIFKVSNVMIPIK